MSYQEFLVEREQIDYFIRRGYLIKRIYENLSGTFVEFELKRSNSSREQKLQKTLHIYNADARKYVSSLLIQQLKQTAAPF
ncbi:hypothetical protein [Anoxybacteroides tepidamans]|uniref:hypothetical protein n=1 Tax=Anoxybacteroides tepidamans TaxID=265948 RepID=UPI000486CEFE|nr:hypothetical protein [Anoxybacillus tepidamans]